MNWESFYAANPRPQVSVDNEIIANIGNLKPGLAVDLGCGYGTNAKWLASRGWRVIAVDSSPKAVELMRKSAAENGMDITAVLGDLTTYEVPQPADLIVLSYVNLDVVQRESLLQRVYSMLAPNGRFVYVGLGRSPQITEDVVGDSITGTMPQPADIAQRLPGMNVVKSAIVWRKLQYQGSEFNGPTVVVSAIRAALPSTPVC